MRKKLDRGITITPKRGRIAGPLAKVGPAYCLSLMLLAFQAISIQSSEASMNLKLMLTIKWIGQNSNVITG
jgi:hypothetical protein